MKDKYQIAAKFGAKTFHDAQLNLITIMAQKSSLKIRVNLTTYKGRQAHKVSITLLECRNIALNIDWDVLRDNDCGQTSYCEADPSYYSATRLVLGQRGLLNIGYHPDIEHPQDKKVDQDLNRLVIFRFVFFGGLMEVLAKDFRFR